MSEKPYQAYGGSGDGIDPALDAAVHTMSQTKPWVRFISVMMFIGSGFMMLGGLGAIVVGLIGAGMGEVEAAFIPFLGVLYIVMAFLYIVPASYLWSYATRIGVLQQQKSLGNLASSLEPQKSFWRFVGILMLVVLVLYAVFFAIAMILPLIAAVSNSTLLP